MEQFRLLNRDGTFNVHRHGIRKRFSSDVYHSLLSMSWPKFLAMLVAVYFAINALFAVAYTLCGEGALAGAPLGDLPERLQNAFFFSVQTLATIGYGGITPHGLPANLLVTFEALLGLLGLALATGLLFARFSRPTARVRFSSVAMMSQHEGVLSFVFRMANARLNQIVEARVKVSLARDEVTAEGEKYRNFYDLELERNESPIFVLSWTVVHPITEKSPLYGITPEALAASRPEIFVTLSGVDETFAQAIHARHSFIPSEIIWGGFFEDILTRTPDGKVMIDLDRMNEYRMS